MKTIVVVAYSDPNQQVEIARTEVHETAGFQQALEIPKGGSLQVLQTYWEPVPPRER